MNDCAKPKRRGQTDQGKFHAINPLLAVRTLQTACSSILPICFLDSRKNNSKQAYCDTLKGRLQTKIVPFSRVLTLRPPTPPPGLVEFWDFEFLCFNLNVGVGTMSPETDFTLEKC